MSNVIDMETTVPTAANVNENSLQPISKEMQLQLSVQHIMTLTHHTQSLQMECHQLMTANTELLQKSAALQCKCNELSTENKELKKSVGTTLEELRKETFGFTNIEESDEKNLPLYCFTNIQCVYNTTVWRKILTVENFDESGFE